MNSDVTSILRYWVLSLSLSALVGCSAANSPQETQQQFNAPTAQSNGTPQPPEARQVPPSNTIPQATPTTPPPNTGQVQPGSGTIQPAPPTNQPAPTQINQQPITQDVTCDAVYHVGNINWQQGQPLLTFTRKPSNVLVNRVPATLTQNNDGSQTFTVLSGDTTTLTFYRDGTCLMQVVGPNESLTVQESGRSQFTVPRPTPPPGGGGGIESMTCRGTIQDSVNFVAYYTQSQGFYQIDFSPRASGNVISVALVNNGPNSQGQQVWRGINSTADVALVHLSTGAPRRGDRIAVQYDGRWGVGNCGGLSALW